MSRIRSSFILSLGALVLGIAHAQSTQSWVFKNQAFAYVYTNIGTVTFDFTAASATNPGQLTTLSTPYPAATAGTFQACINALVTSSLSLSAQSTAPTSTYTPATLPSACTFAPTSVSSNGTFSVTWPSGDNADGALLVITNSPTWRAEASIGAWSTPGGLTAQIVPDLVNSGKLVNGASPVSLSATPAELSAQPGSTTDNYSYYTQYQGYYVVPELFALQVNPSAAGAQVNGTNTATVTYTVAFP
jgi:hypothetical protein